MHLPRSLSGLMALASLALLSISAQPAQSATVRQMNLEEMVGRAGMIFRGTIVDVRPGTVQIGGGELPTVIYTVRVDEPFKGTFDEAKGVAVAEIQMVGELKPLVAGNVRRLSILPELPSFQIGHDYLILTTPPSSYGLSTTVGLGQGAFQLTGKSGSEVAANEFNNVGLWNGMNVSVQGGGAVPYADLAAQIRQLLGQ
jgi:hypothetical protein